MALDSKTLLEEAAARRYGAGMSIELRLKADIGQPTRDARAVEGAPAVLVASDDDLARRLEKTFKIKIEVE
jgi:hypothetical protein